MIKIEYKSFKTQIYPSKNQIKYFQKCFGLRRWYWNWALETYLNEYNKNKKKMSAYNLAKYINTEVFAKGQYLWAKECHSSIRQVVFEELYKSWKFYYNQLNKSKKTNEKIDCEKYKPQFKSKKYSPKSFTTKTSKFHVLRKNISGKYFKLPMYGEHSSKAKPMSLKLAENIEWLKDDNINIRSIIIKQIADRYYIYFVYERTNYIQKQIPCEDTKIGIDMGMKTPLTCWDGTKEYKFNPLDRIKKAEKHRKHCDRLFIKKLDSYRKQQNKKEYEGIQYRESNRYKKARTRLQKAYQREEYIKQDFREQTTTWLVRNYHTINIEPFTDGFKKSRRALARISQYAFYKRLQEKALEYNTDIHWISWEPTTQKCNVCGNILKGENKLGLKDRIYKCPVCGNVEDRDVNAAKNIYNMKPEKM